MILNVFPSLDDSMISYATDWAVTKRALSMNLFQFAFFLLHVFIFNWISDKLIYLINMYKHCISFCSALKWTQLSGKQINLFKKKKKKRFQELSPQVQLRTVVKGCLLLQLNDENDQRRPDHFAWGRLQHHHTRAHPPCCCKPRSARSWSSRLLTWLIFQFTCLKQ